MIYLQFTESPRFEKRASKLIGDDQIAEIQIEISVLPEVGKLIPNSGGIRKMRCPASGHGKRGGARVIYYLLLSRGRVLLLDIYAKNEKENLTREELGTLKREVEVWREQL